MEDQAEKMEALKKAYAEIILNTAKEAATRAMASECKALRFHHDLRHTKDEALQMLLRFKHMIDSTTTEAEKTSMSQQKRINELDTQLNETEGVILDLREELRKAHERLEEAKKNHMQQPNEPSENKQMANTETTPLKKSCNPAKENDIFISNPKEPELYRNGYTHRIRAIERSLVDEKTISNDNEKKDEMLTENSGECNLRRSIRKRKVRCWDEQSSLFKSRAPLSCKYSSNEDEEFDEDGHNFKSKSLSEVNQTIVPISTTSANASKATKCDGKHVETDNTEKNKNLKYTFSRKRKKGILSKSDDKKQDIKEEASSDRENMVEVACQLISLRRVML